MKSCFLISEYWMTQLLSYISNIGGLKVLFFLIPKIQWLFIVRGLGHHHSTLDMSIGVHIVIKRFIFIFRSVFYIYLIFTFLWVIRVSYMGKRSS